MKCKMYNELISAYVDEMLSPQEEEKLMAHLEVCEVCRKEVHALKQMKYLYGQLGTTDLPEGFHEKLMYRIQKEKQGKLRLPLKWRWQYSGALVATLMIGFLGLYQVIKIEPQNDAAIENRTGIQATPFAIGESTPDEGVPFQVANDEVVSEDEMSRSKVASIEQSNEKTNLAITWQIKIEESASFLKALKAYLEESKIQYEETNEGVVCYQVRTSEPLMNWVKSQGATCEGESPQTIGELVIKISE